VEGKKVSIVWYQTIRVDASGWEGSHCSVGVRRSMIEAILTGVIERHRGNTNMSKVGGWIRKETAVFNKLIIQNKIGGEKS